MPDQLGIFDAPARAAKRDPETSHLAAESIAKDGTLQRQRRETLEALARWMVERDDYPTSAELAGVGNLRLRFAYARRLPELAEDSCGLVSRGPKRTCAVTGRLSHVWRLTDAGRKAVNQGR